MSTHDTIRTNHAGKQAAAKRDGRHEKANATTRPFAVAGPVGAILDVAPQLFAALRELVQLQDLKIAAKDNPDLLALYERHKPQAWADARAAIALVEGRA